MTSVLSRSGSLSSSLLSMMATPTMTATSPPLHPLQEEKTKPYYADDKTHLHLRMGTLRILDFGFWISRKRRAEMVVKRAKKDSQRRLGKGIGCGGMSEGKASSSSGLTRQRVVEDIEDLEMHPQSQQSHSPSQPQSSLPLEFPMSQESDASPPPAMEALTLPSLHNLPAQYISQTTADDYSQIRSLTGSVPADVQERFPGLALSAPDMSGSDPNGGGGRGEIGEGGGGRGGEGVALGVASPHPPPQQNYNPIYDLE
ncbi:hypothetical protein EV368DRAFT_88553 [Lentinula lateritia]|nr:hypothetical protein EV368DRAFT_88553 [Lentinula lateritia]